MDKKYLKWSLLGAFAIILLAVPLMLLSYATFGCQTCTSVLGGAGLLLFMLGFFALSICPCVAFIDIALLPGLSDRDKTIWIIVVFLLGFIGAAAYYLLIRRKQK